MHTFALDPKHPTPSAADVLCIGNFDGVHLGHQAMISHAKTFGQKVAVMVFEPQPKEFFGQAIPRLSSLEEKHTQLQALGVDELYIARFDGEFATLSASEFCKLLQKMGITTIVVGGDFCFGKGRCGNVQTLSDFGFLTHSLDDVCYGDQRISSTAIRHALAQGDLAQANALLGRAYAITGKVIHGDKIGRTLGFATANLTPNRRVAAVGGVFGADVFCDDFGGFGGVAGSVAGSLFGCVNIGTRPSVGGRELRFEVHLPTFFGDLYGKTLTVSFLYFLHPERNYPSTKTLKDGIADDVQRLLSLHQNRP